MKPNKERGTIKMVYSLAILMAAIGVLAISMFLGASEIDNRIVSSAQKSYVFKTYLKNDAILIKSKDEVVTLTGTVSDESHQFLAEDTVAGLPGVARVDNRLEVKGDRPSQNSDAWVVMQVKTVLLFHRNVSAPGTDVSVKNGVVTLRGEAANEAQKELTAEYAKEVEGVKEVRNEMIVSKTPRRTNETLGEKIDDASITAQAKMTLLFHNATSARNTKVETNEGVVTLSGKAQNPAEKDLATKLVSDINGVKAVVNTMTIE